MMEYVHAEKQQNIEITLKGKFTFADNKEFLIFLESQLAKQYSTIILDIEGVNFIDSAALGMLLLIRDKCSKASVGLIIRKPTGQVQQMFKISKFDRLFRIE